MCIGNGENKGDVSVKPFLMNGEQRTGITQEIIITREGGLDIQWITPRSSNLILRLWHDLNGKEPFPVGIISGNIYCG